MTRISKDEYYLRIAKAVALRSPCLRRKYGAIVVKNDVIVSTGYNGPARGSTNCEEVGCIKDELNLPHYSAYEYCPAIHAEENCVSGDTLIVTADGSIRKARNVNTVLISVDPFLFTNVKVLSQKIESTKSEVLRITTKGGFFIEVSPEHRMLVMDRNLFLKEKPAKNITLKDYLPVPSILHIDGKPQKLPKIDFNYYRLIRGSWEKFYRIMKSKGYTWRKLCEKCGFSFSVLSNLKNYKAIKKEHMEKILEIFPEVEGIIEGYEVKRVKIPETTSPLFCQIAGYFMGDGSLSKNYIAFHDSKKEVLLYYNTLIKRVFGIEGKIRKSWKGTHYVLIVSSRRLYLLFKELRFNISKNKRIPVLFHRVENKSLSRFIRGLFDAEGVVDERSIHLSSSSKELIYTLRLLLLRFGIFSTIYKIKRSKGFKNSSYYSLEICGDDIVKFDKEIGFSHKDKEKRLKEIIVKGNFKFSSLRVYPVEWFKKFKISSSISSALRDKNKINVTYPLARLFINEIKKREYNEDVERLERMVENIVFLKVKKIERINRKMKMFDFYAPPFHNFIANGIIVHNCIINAARNGSSVLNGTLYLYGIDVKTGKPVAGIPCSRCKRVLINAGIKNVVTINEKGEIVRYSVDKWVEEDKRNYIKLFKERVLRFK